ncbi:MAG: hypothetical protein SOY42_06390 [Clostridium sp.]|nr:hypothetical protein [Clostridium sp.]
MKFENKVCKYELSKILKSMMIFYFIYFFIIILIKILSCFFEGFDGITEGTDLSTIVFVGIIALTILKPAFKFSQYNNISRKKFIEGTIKSGVFISIIMSSIDLILKFTLNQIYHLFSKYSIHDFIGYNYTLFEKVYEKGLYLPKVTNVLMDYLFKFSLCLFVYMSCLCFSTIYFKLSSEKKKILATVSIIILFAFISFDSIRFAIGGLIGNNYIIEPIIFIILSIILMMLEFFISKDLTESEEKINKNNKMCKLVVGILIIVISLFLYINKSNEYIYVKYNGNLYIITGETSKEVGVYLGKVESKVPLFIKPLIDSQSNGFPIGTELYSGGKGGVSMIGEQTEYIYVKFDEKYWYLYNAKSMGALNGYKVKIRSGKVELD